MPFRSKNRSGWKTHVSLPDGRRITAGCGTSSLETALAVEGMVKTMRRQRGPTNLAILILIVEKKAKLSDVFDAYERKELEGLLEAQSTPNLSALLDKWPGRQRAKDQIRKMIPAGKPYLATAFTKAAVRSFLDTLTFVRSPKGKPIPVSGSTVRRYHSALRTYGAWLTEHDHISYNPVRDVSPAKENKPVPRFLDRSEAILLLGALSMPNRAIEALMASCGVEWQVITRLRKRDVDLKARTVHCSGSKNEWRTRTVRATEIWAWDIFAGYVKSHMFAPNALIFPGVKHSAALRTHKRVAAELELKFTTLHDWRHTYAVQALKDGFKPTVVARQLGHANAYLVWTRYGRYVPDERDYVRQGEDRSNLSHLSKD